MNKAKKILSKISLIAILGSIFTPSILVYGEESKGDIIAYLKNSEGKVFIGNSYATDDELSLVYEGDKVWTLKDGKTEIVFKDGSIIRLEGLTTILIKDKTEDTQNLEVARGTLWGRILKPMGSGTEYNIETSSISAAVRGTSIYVKHSKTYGRTGIKVIDSYSDNEESEGIDIINKKNNEKIKVGKEEMFLISHNTNKYKKQKLDIETELKKEDIQSNSQKDIIYMTTLLDEIEESSTDETNTSTPLLNIVEKKMVDIDKIAGEIEETAPKDEKEAEAFFKSKDVAKKFIEKRNKKLQEANGVVSSMSEKPKLGRLLASTTSEYILKDEIINELENTDEELIEIDYTTEDNIDKKELKRKLKEEILNKNLEDDIGDIIKEDKSENKIEKTLDKVIEKTSKEDDSNLKNFTKELNKAVKEKINYREEVKKELQDTNLDELADKIKDGVDEKKELNENIKELENSKEEAESKEEVEEIDNEIVENKKALDKINEKQKLLKERTNKEIEYQIELTEDKEELKEKIKNFKENLRNTTDSSNNPSNTDDTTDNPDETETNNNTDDTYILESDNNNENSSTTKDEEKDNSKNIKKNKEKWTELRNNKLKNENSDDEANPTSKDEEKDKLKNRLRNYNNWNSTNHY